MDKKNYKWVIYFIGITIGLTIAVQFYWNYKEYQQNKKNLVGKVQLSLDNAVEDYYANLTRSGFITLTSPDSVNSNKIDSILVKTKSRKELRKKIDSTLQFIAQKDSNKVFYLGGWRSNNPNLLNPHRERFPKNLDSIISKIVVSFSRDTLNLESLGNHLQTELNRNKIDVNYALKFDYYKWIEKDSFASRTITHNIAKLPKKHLVTVSKSHYLPSRTNLELLFSNETEALLKDSLVSIFLSLLLSTSIILSILYLLKTIYKQKQLAEVKNDLISNITHEFKTPIATIATALEAMKNFNALNNKEKSEKYISIANDQVIKLNQMVEKILESATLNQDDLAIEKEPIDIINLINKVIEKYKFINPNKTFNFNHNVKTKILKVDQFHFENAIGNIIDNSVKYGGNTISIELINSEKHVELNFSDSGNGISKPQKEKVFEQFYRIPTGNTHDVKGFGIGLYYTKNIIERHQGSIHITYDSNNKTIIKIKLLNE
jgi:two-component system phosphate regulon sensor histidine kinase PhoR